MGCRSNFFSLVYLLLSILSSTGIFVVFKLFERFQVNIFQAIVTNYVVACTCGLLFYSGEVSLDYLSGQSWFVYTLVLGLLFITVFNLMALTTQRNGLSVVSVATKMSVVVPILFGLFYYKESTGALKLIGIALALTSVYLVSLRGESTTNKNKGFVLPLLVFLGSGVIDTGIKFLEESFVAENDVPIFSATIFGSAAIIGIVVIVGQILIGRAKIQLKNIVGGICLGVPNYFSVYFLVQSLRSEILDSSGIFTVNNVAIVMLSTLVGILLFTEKLSLKNWMGIALAVISIFAMAAATL